MDDLKLSLNSMEVLKKRYLLKDDNQNIVETPDELFRRVAGNIAKGEKNFKRGNDAAGVEESFYGMMKDLEFMPNSPTLMNAGTSLGQLSACFVLPVGDSIGDIFTSLGNMAKIHQTGGGTGFDFSHLRPKDDLVSTTKGGASGPVSFMRIFDTATGVILQGGRRRGANMGILRCDHPDIIEFIEAKLDKGAFSNFNLSVGITGKFMRAVRTGDDFDLINPRTKRKARKISARVVFNLIALAAWRTGDPGLIFLDAINAKNPTPGIGAIEATNPCGELPLLPYESCNLASINLSKMVRGGNVDWKKIRSCVRLGIRFLDDVIEVNKFPLTQIRNITFDNRKIGLGVMGFADMLIKLGIPYNSAKAVSFAGGLMRFVRAASVAASVDLARERGVFPNYKRSIYAKRGLRLRNATVNTIAPTGTVSIIAECSSGIEPIFAISFIRNILSGAKLFETNPIFKEMAKGGLRKTKEVPAAFKKIFITAFDVAPETHLHIQDAFQKHTDNSVSKTINLPQGATVEDVKNIYLTAYKLRLKGITVYRYGSKEGQVLSFNYGARHKLAAGSVVAGSEYSGGCVAGICPF
ncbi:MAG: adenosylcobalamin-dependent ribonucleoside-diphosphate reductase [Candidatus Omnitrophota bacterium]